MISVDIYVPYTGATYDFCLEENVETRIVIEEVLASICAKERLPAIKSIRSLELYDLDAKKQISRDSTLYEAGIRSGQTLELC